MTRKVADDENVFEHLQNDINAANAEIRRLTKEYDEEIRRMAEDSTVLTYLLADRDNRLRDLHAALYVCEFDKGHSESVRAYQKMMKMVDRILSRDDENIPEGGAGNSAPAWKYDFKVRKQAERAEREEREVVDG